MSNFKLVIEQNGLETQKRYHNRKIHIEEKMKEIPSQYEGDIRRYREYCWRTGQIVGTEAMLDYLYSSLTEKRIKKTTWERRLAAIKKYLSVAYKIEFKGEARIAYELSAMRKMYREDQYAHLLQVRGKSAIDKKELMDTLNKLPIREKAIYLVNLVTANRPNEIDRLKTRNIELKNRSVHVYLKKQNRWHTKWLKQDAINTIKLCIHEYGLRPEDYFVGRVYINGRYESTAIADLSTIAQQIGHHQSLDMLI